MCLAELLTPTILRKGHGLDAACFNIPGGGSLTGTASKSTLTDRKCGVFWCCAAEQPTSPRP